MTNLIMQFIVYVIVIFTTLTIYKSYLDKQHKKEIEKKNKDIEQILKDFKEYQTEIIIKLLNKGYQIK